jgi:cell division protein FtsW (lipid II flippase)
MQVAAQAPLVHARKAVAARPGVALGAAALGIVLLPLLHPKLPGNAAPVDVTLLLAVTATLLWAAASGQRVRFPYVVPVTVLVVAGTVAALLGDFPQRGAVALVQDLFLLAWCWAVANLARTPEAVSVLLRAWVWSAMAWAALLVVAVMANVPSIGGFDVEGGRAQLTFDHPNLAGSYFAVSLLVLWVGRRSRRPFAPLAASALLVTALLLTGSNAAIGGLVAGSLVAWVVSLTRNRRPILAVGIVAAVLSAAVLTALSINSTDVIDATQKSTNSLLRISLGRLERSTQDRAVQIQQLASLYRSGGLVGHGPASTQDVLLASGAPYVKEAHNDTAAVLVERGVLGGIGLILLIGAVGIRAVRLAHGLNDRYRRVVRSVYPLIGALVALSVMSLTHEVLHYRHLWALLGIVAGLYLWGRTAPSEERPA